MTWLASILFLTALAGSLVCIFGGIANNRVRIAEVIENRNGKRRPVRRITAMPVQYSGFRRDIRTALTRPAAARIKPAAATPVMIPYFQNAATLDRPHLLAA